VSCLPGDAGAAALSTYRAIVTDALTGVGCAGGVPGCILGKFGGELVTQGVAWYSNVASGLATGISCVGSIADDGKEGGFTRKNLRNCGVSILITGIGMIPEANIDAIAADYQLCRDLGKCHPK